MAAWCWITDQSPESYKALTKLERSEFVAYYVDAGPKVRVMGMGGKK